MVLMEKFSAEEWASLVRRYAPTDKPAALAQDIEATLG